MLLHTTEDYFDMALAGKPYGTSREEAEDYFALLSLALEAYSSAYLEDKGRRRENLAGPAFGEKPISAEDAFLAGYFAYDPADRAFPTETPAGVDGGMNADSSATDAEGSVGADGAREWDIFSPAGEAREELRTAFAHIESREAATTKCNFVRKLIDALDLSRAELMALLLAASVHKNGEFGRIFRALSGGSKDRFATVGFGQKLLRFCFGGETDVFAADGKLYTWLLVRRKDGGKVLLPERDEPLVITPYARMLIEGSTVGGGAIHTDSPAKTARKGSTQKASDCYPRIPDGIVLAPLTEETEFFSDEVEGLLRDIRESFEERRNLDGSKEAKVAGSGSVGIKEASATARVRKTKTASKDVRAERSAAPNTFRKIVATDIADVRYVLEQTAARLQLPLYLTDTSHLPETTAGRKAVLLHLRLFPGILLFDMEGDGEGAASFLRTMLQRLYGMHIYVCNEGVMSPGGRLPADMTPGILKLSVPDVTVREKLWEYFLAKEGLVPDTDVDLFDIADCHENSLGQIRCVVSQAKETIAARNGRQDNVLTRELLQELLFALSSSDFKELATEIKAQYTWDDIFLEDSAKQRLRTACDRFRLRNRIGAEWGINKKNAYGNAVIVLMYGAPGTGKTMAAQAIANEVMTPLFRVDVSQIFSKYIGETQKNLSRIFDEAAKRSVVLFFDEADALFTRRTEIRDSHDKYANSDTSFLLQKVEEYNGISILATNNYQSFDPAFMRRLTYVVHFERPDEATRKKMWETMLPEQVPMGADVDFQFLAEHFTEFSGSNIKSVLLASAYMAGAKHQPVGMKDIITAIVYEYEKLGRLIDSAEFGSYALYL